MSRWIDVPTEASAEPTAAPKEIPTIALEAVPPAVKVDPVVIELTPDNKATLHTPESDLADSDEDVVEDSGDSEAPTEEAVVDYTSEIEGEARSHGWVPSDEWKGPKWKWTDAKTFIERGALFRRQEESNKRLEEQNRIIKTLASTMKAERAKGYEQGKTEILHEIQVARNTGDFNKYDQAMKKSEELEAQYKDIKEAAGDNPEFNEWYSENAWFGDTTTPVKQAMTSYALKVAGDYYRQSQDKGRATTGSEYTKGELVYVNKLVKEAFSTYEGFKSPELTPATPEPVQKVAPTTGGTRGAATAALKTSGMSEGEMMRHLTPAQKEIIKYMERENQDYKDTLKFFVANLKS